MSFFRDKKYDANLYYEVVGEGEPFLLIHGWAIDHRFLKNALEPAFAMTKEKFQRIYVDVPGMGESEPGTVKNGDGVVDVIMSFMDEVFPGQSFYIGGNSFGASVTRAIIAKYPGRIKGAMLIVPSNGAGDRVRPKEGCFRRDDEFLATLSPKEKAAFCQMNANLTKECFERFMRDAYPSVSAGSENEFLKKTLRGRFSFDVTAALEKLRFDKSVLILTGKYDTAVGYESQFKWLSYFPKATYTLIDGAGHNANIDRPSLFTFAVAGWLSGLNEL